MKRILIFYLYLLPFCVIGQRDSIIYNSPINSNVSDIAKKYIVFNPGFFFSATSQTNLQSKIVALNNNTVLSLRKVGNITRQFSYFNNKLEKIINLTNEDIVAIDSLFYDGDTLKLIKNYIVGNGNNSLRLFNFYYSPNSLYPIGYTRTGIRHSLIFANNGNLLQDRTEAHPYQTSFFTYNSMGNVTYIDEGGYRITYYSTHDTSYSLYSNSIALKLWTYVKGLSTTQFSVNNPINYTQPLNVGTAVGTIKYKYDSSGYPKEFLISDDKGYSNFEEFEYYENQ